MHSSRLKSSFCAACACVFLVGCGHTQPTLNQHARQVPHAAMLTSDSVGEAPKAAAYSLVSFAEDDAAGEAEEVPAVRVEPDVSDDVDSFVLVARRTNPTLRRLRSEFDALRAKAAYADKMPDPTIGTNVFVSPIETAAGSQRANLQVAQMIPWLHRLDAQQQQACLEAMAARQVLLSEELRVVGDVRASWAKLYVLHHQLKANRATSELVETLIKTANARIASGKGAAGDVLVATVELGKLEEQRLTLEQQVASVKAELNRLLSRPTETAIAGPTTIDAALPDWSHPMLRQIAFDNQPAFAAAQLRIQASQWGIEVARLRRRPDLAVNATWYAMEGNRPEPNIVNVGEDAWSMGVQMSVPLWRGKYDAMQQEAAHKHYAAHASDAELRDRYDSLLRDLWEQAKALDETAKLYDSTIVPQAKRTLESDQKSLAQGAVDFDRVLQDARNLLTLEVSYHRAVGQLSATLARIYQATGEW